MSKDTELRGDSAGIPNLGRLSPEPKSNLQHADAPPGGFTTVIHHPETPRQNLLLQGQGRRGKRTGFHQTLPYPVWSRRWF